MKIRNLVRWVPVVLTPAVMATAFMGTGSAQASPAVHSPSPAARACHAFTQWEHHRTTGRLDAMLTASERAPWDAIGADVVVVYTDVRDGDHLDLPADVKSLAQDC
jgi:hypothetical protein